MKKILLSLFAAISLQANAQCLEITSIFVDACGPTEGENEMFTFETGTSALNINDISVSWPNNNFLGWCQDASTASSTASLNATITSSCGFLLEPTGGVIPANSNVLVITSTNISLVDNSFEGLADTMYIVYQCAGNTSGHFANSGSGDRTLTVSVSGACNSVDAVTYSRSSLTGGDGATVLFDAAGNATYINNGCNAPVVTINPFWSFTNAICQNFGDVDLNSLLSSNATTGGTWTGNGVTGNIFNPSGILGSTSITYSVSSSGACAIPEDSTITFSVDTTPVITDLVQACDSAFVNGTWYSTDAFVTFSTPGIPPYGCSTQNEITVDITGSIIDSTYLFSCDSVFFNGLWYTSSVELRDTVTGVPSTPGNSCTELFISEYGEGSSFNKYIEIYNGTDNPIDLSTYTINVFFNGGTTPGTGSPISLSGILLPGETYVIVNSNSGVNAALQALADQFASGINFNGDDAVGLYNNGILIDLIGNIGCDPGTQWSNGSLSTADNSIIRNPDYTTGVALDPANAPCDFPTLTATNWTALGNDNWSNVGLHTANCGGTGSSGCDTIFITTIEIAPPTIFNTVNLCTNNTLEAGSVNDTLFSTTGCDSLITTTITTLVSPSQNITQACTNNPANVGTDTTSVILSALGCDSVYLVTNTTLITPVNESLPAITGCNQVVFDGNTYTSNTTLNDTVLSNLGCDSVYTQRNIIVNLPVSVQNPNNPIIICDNGEFATLPDGSTVSAAGTYPVTFTNGASNGCDSTIITSVVTQNCDLSCTLDTALFESYEFTGPVPGIVPGSVFQPNTTEATGIFAGRARTGNRFLYMNIQNGYQGIVYSINMDVCPGTEFNISFWIRQYDNSPGSNFNINVYDGSDNTAPLLSTQNIVNNGTVYNERVTPPLIASGSVITFELFTNTPGGNGNDICFDDLLLQVCQLDTIVAQPVEYCSNENSQNLYNLISSQVGADGIWSGPSVLANGFQGTFDPSNSLPGTYIYTKAGISNCADTIVTIAVNVLNEVTVQNPNNPIVICDNGELATLPDGSTVSAAGTYPVTISNGASNGCDSTIVTIVETQVCTIVCENDFTLGADVNLCFGEELTLNAPAGYDSYLWQDGSTNQSFTANASGTYYCVTTQVDLSNNLVVNGDFEQGNTGFTTDYVVGTGGSFGQLSNPATYAISTSPSNVHNNFAVCSDQTTGTGNMFIANGADIPNTNVWCQTINIAPNTDYLFSTWVTNVTNDPNVAILQFSINGVQIGNNFSPTPTACQWQQFDATWNSGVSTSAQICIVNQNTSGGGNDFALDDIFFTPVCIYSDTVEIQIAEQAIENFETNCTNNPSEAGTFTTIIPNNFGCDSIINNLTVTLINAFTETTSTQCTNNAANAGLNITDTILSNQGCDSIYLATNVIFVDLEVNQTTLSGCDSVRWDGTTYFENFETTDTILSSLGCDSIISSLFITVGTTPVANAGEDVTILLGESTTLIGEEGNEYLWTWPGNSSDEQTIEVSPAESTLYTLTVSNDDCSDIDSVLVTVINKIVLPFIPDAFTPNNDGINDLFEIVNAEDFENIVLRIYNRWGELIYEGFDQNHGWDGTYNGQLQNTGVYVYYITANSIYNGQNFSEKGSVTLIR